MNEEQISQAEERAIERLDAEAYMLSEGNTPGMQKKAFHAYQELLRHGARVMVEELYKQIEKS